MLRGGNNWRDWVHLEFTVVFQLISESYFNIPHGGRTNVLGKNKYYLFDYHTTLYSLRSLWYKQIQKGENIISILQTSNSDTVAIFDTDFSASSGTPPSSDFQISMLMPRHRIILTPGRIQRYVKFCMWVIFSRWYICAVEHGIWQTASKPSTGDSGCHL